MKRLLMALFLLCTVIQSAPASANGSTTVYLTVSRFNFSVSIKPIFELENKKLFDLFESNNKPNAYVVSINPYLFNQVHLYNCWGYDAVITFEEYGSVAFRYYPQYKATIGFNKMGEPIILQPRTIGGHTVKTPLCEGEEPCENEVEDTEGFRFDN